MLHIKDVGFFTTVQDLGRFGNRHYGVPVSGVMDEDAVRIVNKLLENDAHDAVLEMTMIGAALEFENPTVICFSGGYCEVLLDNVSLRSNTPYSIKAQQKLVFGRIMEGVRTYLGVKGGFLTPSILGSRSQYHPITKSSSCKNGDAIAYQSIENFTPRLTSLTQKNTFKETVLHASAGPEYDWLSKAQQNLLVNQYFHIAKENNRMAYQLQETLAENNFRMITSATLPGTVQLTPSGKLIILMKDGQTTGGYPRVLQLSNEAIGILAQKKHLDYIQFKLL